MKKIILSIEDCERKIIYFENLRSMIDNDSDLEAIDSMIEYLEAEIELLKK